MKANQAKALGQFILLLAFLGQWWFLDAVRDEERDMTDAAFMYMGSKTGSALRYLTYFSDNNVEHLRRAAADEHNTLLIMMSRAQLSRDAELEVIARLQLAGEKVIDADSYRAFREVAIRQDTKIKGWFQARRERLESQKAVSWWVVVCMTILGFSSLAYGELRDEKVLNKS